MQTFLPHPDFNVCAALLDPVRLNRQIQECAWIASLLRKADKKGIAAKGMHPVVKLWTNSMTGRPYIATLRKYQAAMHRVYRKINVHASFWFCNWMDEYPPDPPIYWLDVLHESHRRALLHKDPIYYRSIFSTFGITVGGPFEGYQWLSPVEGAKPSAAPQGANLNPGGSSGDHPRVQP